MSYVVVVDELNLWVQIKDTKSLNEVGVNDRAMLLRDGIQGCYIQMSKILYNPKDKNYYFLEEVSSMTRGRGEMTIPIYCTEFDFEGFREANLEYFV